MIVLIVHFKVWPGKEARTLDLIRILQEHSRREPGCRMYVGHQSTEDPRSFCFYEQYDSQAALDAHRAAPYFTEYVVNGLANQIESRTQELFVPVD